MATTTTLYNAAFEILTFAGPSSTVQCVLSGGPNIGLTPLAAAPRMDFPDDRVRCNSTFCDFSPLTLNGQRYFRKAILPCIRKPMAMHGVGATREGTVQ